MRIDGWNFIPRGYGLSWDLQGAPSCLRAWFHLPLVERFAFPVMIRRGHAYLVKIPNLPVDDYDPVPYGWQVRTEDGQWGDGPWFNRRPDDDQ